MENNFLLIGSVVVVVVLIVICIGFVILCFSRKNQYHRGRPRCLRPLRYGQGQRYSQSQIVASGQEVDYTWTLVKDESVAQSDITFVLELQETQDGVTDGSKLTNWDPPLISQTLYVDSGSHLYEYTVNGKEYKYSLSDDDSLGLLHSNTTYWSRIQSISDANVKSDWDYSAKSFTVTGAIDEAADLVSVNAVNKYYCLYGITDEDKIPVTWYWTLPANADTTAVPFSTVQNLTFIFSLDTNKWSDYGVKSFNVAEKYDVVVSDADLTVTIITSGTGPTPLDHDIDCVKDIVPLLSDIILDKSNNYYFVLVAPDLPTQIMGPDQVTLRTNGAPGPTILTLECIAVSYDTDLKIECAPNTPSAGECYSDQSGTALCCAYDDKAGPGVPSSVGADIICWGTDDADKAVLQGTAGPGALIKFSWTATYTAGDAPYMPGAVLTTRAGADTYYDWSTIGEQTDLTFVAPVGYYDSLKNRYVFSLNYIVQDATGHGQICVNKAQSVYDSLAVDGPHPTALVGVWDDGSS